VKRKISISIDKEVADELQKLFPYSSSFISSLIEEFFRNVSIEAVWNSIQMDKPQTNRERVNGLKKFIKEKMAILSSHNISHDTTTSISPNDPPNTNGEIKKKKITEESAWKEFN